MEDFGSKYFRGQGKLFAGSRNAAGKPVGLVFLGDLSSAEVSPQVERDEIIENVTGSSGVGASWLRRSQFNIQIAMRSIRKDHLAAALQGTATDKTAGSVTDEAHTVALGKFSPLVHNKVSSVVVTGAGGSPTYVADTDYKVHADEGFIEWLSGGSVTEALAVLIDYSYAAQYHVPSSPGNLDKYLVFAGKNTADNDKMTRCELYKVKLDPSALALITDTAADMQLAGVVQLDSLRPAGDQFFSWKVET